MNREERHEYRPRSVRPPEDLSSRKSGKGPSLTPTEIYSSSKRAPEKPEAPNEVFRDAAADELRRELDATRTQEITAITGEIQSGEANSYLTQLNEEKQKRLREQAKLEERESKRRSRYKGRKNRRLFRIVWAVMVILVAVTVGEVLARGAADVFAMTRKTDTTAEVEIPENCSLDEVTEILYKNGAITNPGFFKFYCNVTNATEFGRGVFDLPLNLDYEGLINFLVSKSNRKDTVSIMFYEGMNVQEIALLLEQNEVCSAQSVLDAVNSDLYDKYDIVAAIPTEAGRVYRLEGYLFPDTYKFYKGEDVEDALSKLIYNCQSKFSKKMRKAMTDSGMTYDQVLTLASLVQAEAATEDEMPLIAGILMNRLNDGASQDIYTLDLDSTVYYPYRTKEDVPASELATFQSAYNTYKVKGLPQGPICNPGLAAINAVLSPEETGYYYFCHDADGNSYFAKTMEGHRENLIEAGLLEE